MDKMREEFEIFHIENCKKLGMDERDIKSELERNGDGYVYHMASEGWKYWKESRAHLCIDMPKGHDLGFNFAVEVVAMQLDSCGVKHK